MDFTVYLPLFLGFTLAAVTPRIARLLPPRTGAWVLSAAAVTASASCAVSLCMIAFTGLGRTSFVAHEGHWSANEWRRSDPVGVWTAAIAGAVFALCLAMFIHACLRELSARRQVDRLSKGFGHDDLLVFVDDDQPHAYAVGGRRPRIVISRGLLRSLEPAERRALLSHETAHVRHRHHLHLLVLRLAAAINPLLRPFVPAGALTVERWADEETAVAVGDRTLVAKALLRAALAGAEHARLPHGVLAHSTGDVPRRVTALMQAPPRPRWSVTAAASMLLVATIVAQGLAANNLDSLFDKASPPAPRLAHGSASTVVVTAQSAR